MAASSQRAFIPPRTLLVLKPSSLGDIVHTLPSVARLKAAWPECRISWLANTEWMPLLQGNPDVDEIIEFPRREFRGFVGMRKLGSWLRSTVVGRRFDLALDFQGLLRSALIGRMSGASHLFGLPDAREGARWMYERAAALPTGPVHAVDRYLALAEFALQTSGKTRHSAAERTICFPLPEGERPTHADVPNEEYILLHPHSRGNGKSLVKKEIHVFLRNLPTKKIVLIGRGEPVNFKLAEGCIDLTNQTSLPELIWLIRHASFVISVDSGPAHLAAAVGRPMIAIHAWSDPRKVGPYRPDAWVWKNGRLVRVRDLGAMENPFFDASPLALYDADIAAICKVAISFGDSSA